jgi:hypothetical protein
LCCVLSIRYFLPEDGDSEAHPNVFLSPKATHPGAPPTLGQIKDAFPLPGSYHFRFKSPVVPGADREKGAMAVWMDCIDDRQIVATWKGAIITKVTRVSMDDDGYDTDDDFDKYRASGTSALAAAAPVRKGGSASAPASRGAQPSIDLFDAPASSGAAGATGNLLDGMGDGRSGGGAVGGGGDLLNMGATTQSAPSSAHNDFMGMTASAPPAHQQNQHQHQQPQQQMPPQRQTGPFGDLF